METAENVATITNFTVFTAPALAVEVAVLAALGVFYFAALHTRLVKSEWLAMHGPELRLTRIHKRGEE